MGNKKLIGLCAAFVALLITTAATTWHWARADLKAVVVDNTLRPIAVLLADNQRLRASLLKDDGVLSESVILSTYLERIRKNGVPKYSGMKQKIDRLVNNDTTIVALLSNYLPLSQRAELRVAGAQFADYASGFRDRWQSLFEIFMAGGNLPARDPEPPANLQHLVQDEIARLD